MGSIWRICPIRCCKTTSLLGCRPRRQGGHLQLNIDAGDPEAWASQASTEGRLSITLGLSRAGVVTDERAGQLAGSAVRLWISFT